MTRRKASSSNADRDADAQRQKVEECAQAVLAAREQFPGSTLSDLYDPVAMPPALAKAHSDLDRAVDRCYRKEAFLTDRQQVEYLFALYEQLAAPLVTARKKNRKSDGRIIGKPALWTAGWPFHQVIPGTNIR